MFSDVYDDELYHHGILGMKWGVRRYQNPDGSLTEAGKKRAIKKDRKQASKNRSLLSDEELDARIKRLEKEKRLRELTDQELNRGKKYTDDIMQNVGRQSMNKIAVEGIAAAGGAAVGVLVKTYLNSKGIPTSMG